MAPPRRREGPEPTRSTPPAWLLIYYAAASEILLLSFLGGLVSGLGQGFDLGIDWPSEPLRLLRAALQGSLEPVHRILTVIAAPLLAAFTVALARSRIGLRLPALLGILSLTFLALTALTGRLILLALGGYFEQPLASLIYSINNLFSTLTLGALVTARVAAEPPGPVERRRAALLLHRGAAAWGLIASFLGALILGYTKTTGEAVDVGLIPSTTPSSWVEIVFRAHQLAGLAAILLTLAAVVYRRGAGAWGLGALAASLVQPLLGLALALRISTSPWAPGVFLPFHLIAAQVIVVGNWAEYAPLLLRGSSPGGSLGRIRKPERES